MTFNDDMAVRVEALRREFDDGFARAPEVGPRETEDVLLIRVAETPYLLRLSDTSGLYADKRVTAVPSRARELLGIAGFRGAIQPVYDLRALLGHAAGKALATAPWLVTVKGMPVALAFDGLEGHMRLGRSAISSDPDGSRGHVSEVARTPALVPVIDVASVLASIERASAGAVERSPR